METILIVDDRAENRDFLVALFEARGWRPLVAANGRRALELVRAERPALVIADVLMPRMDGYEFVRQLRADPEIAETRVIFYTASYVEAEARRLAEACGVTDIIVKPCEPAEILRLVEKALGAPPADTPLGQPHEEFRHEHLQLVTDKLAGKVDELERLNAELEGRVAQRTADLSAANERLTGLNRMKDEFLAIVSHDLRSPLSGILIGAEIILARGDTLSAEKRNDFLRKIVVCVNEQLAFVSDLLHLAQNESGHTKLQWENVRLSEALQDSMRGFAFNAEAKQIALSLSAPPDEPLLPVDRARLRQVFSNLLANAIKFTRAGGEIALSVEVREREVIARVSDNGIGIPAAHMARLFEKFKPEHRLGTAGEAGTGLGLAIVRQLVELHHGRVEVESHLGRGTTFSVFLPRAQATEPERPAPEAP